MSENKPAQHTPGPWAFDAKRDTVHSCNVDYQFSMICKVATGEDRKQEDANAKLIAAAPDLLDAVEHVLIASEDGGKMNDIDFNLLRAAIAKATT